MNRITIPLGIVAGLGLSVVMISLLRAADFSNIEEISAGTGEMFLGALGAVSAMIIIAIKNPEIKFTRLVKHGVITAAVSSVFFFIVYFIYIKWIDKDFLPNYSEAVINHRAATITDAHKKAEYLANYEANKDVYANPFWYTLIPSLTIFMFSLMPIAICGYLVFRVNRRKQLKQKQVK